MFKIKSALSAVVCISLILCSASCGKKADVEKKTETTQSSTTVTSAETKATTTKKTETTKAEEEAPKETKKKKNFNILTGKNDVSKSAAGKRPVAIMINNISASLPQYGIYDADVMFECPVEGGITRMMALYADYTKVPDVCSVRSCRYYFAYFASSFDAVYLHWGIDKYIAANKLETLAIDHIDGEYNSVLFKRDPNRVGAYSTEHTGYCDGSEIPAQIKASGIRSKLTESSNKAAFSFTDKFKKLSDEAATKVNIQFSNSYYSTFTYDKKSKTYKKQHNGSKHMDSAASKQLAYTNVIVLASNDIKVIKNDNGLLSLDWKGGYGYCFSAGTVRKITWSKESEKGRLVLKTTDGKELKINSGKTYIGVTKAKTTSYS